MKFIPIGLQCAVPDAIKKSNLREYSYPFDWLWTPSKTTYEILCILLEKGIEETVTYMTTGYSYYKYLGDEKYKSIDTETMEQLNKTTGLGITHFVINDEYKEKLYRRLERLLTDIKSNNKIVLMYADAADKNTNYVIDDIVYSINPTEYLLKIYDLIYPINQNIELLYFCWDERKQKDNSKINFIPFSSIKNWFIRDWNGVSILIQQYLEKNIDKYYLS
jgi:hypothetical protein